MGVYRHIVVRVDGSDASAQAADMAGRLALDLDAKLTVVFVRRLPAVAPSPFAITIDLDNYEAIRSGWPQAVPPRSWTGSAPPGGSRCAPATRPSSSSGPPRRTAPTSSSSAPAATRWPAGCCSGRSPPDCCTTPTGRCSSPAERNDLTRQPEGGS